MGLKERREREKLERKKQILDAARTLLLDKGLQATSINRIAKVAELGVATLYSYYKNKEDIYVALQEEGLSLLYSKIKEAARKGKTPSDKIKKMALAYYQFSEVQKDYFDVINYFLTAPRVIFSQGKKTLVDLLGDKILSELKEAIDKGSQEGVYQKVNTTRSALVFWAALNGLIQFKKMKTTLLQGESHKALYTFAVEQFIRGLMVDRPLCQP
jgi:TetR/AcrR family transcriptional regulator